MAMRKHLTGIEMALAMRLEFLDLIVHFCRLCTNITHFRKKAEAPQQIGIPSGDPRQSCRVGSSDPLHDIWAPLSGLFLSFAMSLIMEEAINVDDPLQP